MSQRSFLLRALEDLSEDDFRAFKWILANLGRIPRHCLQGLNRDQTAHLLLQIEGGNALAVTRMCLKAIRRNDLVMTLSYIIDEDFTTTPGGTQHLETEDLRNITQDLNRREAELWELKIDLFLNHFGLQREDVPEGLRSIRLEELDQILPLMDHQPETREEMLEELDEIIVRLRGEGDLDLAMVLSDNNPGVFTTTPGGTQHLETEHLRKITQDLNRREAELWELRIDLFLNQFELRREDVPEAGLRSITLKELEQILPLMDHQPETTDEMLKKLDEIIVRLGGEGYPELAKILSDKSPGECLR